MRTASRACRSDRAGLPEEALPSFRAASIRAGVTSLGGGAAALSGCAKTVAAPTARPPLSTVRRETCVWSMPSLPCAARLKASLIVSLYLRQELGQPGDASVVYDSAPKMR